jgi:hypothetical protein
VTSSSAELAGAADESITRSHEANGGGDKERSPGNLPLFVSSCEKNVPRNPCGMGSWLAADVIGAAQRLCALCGSVAKSSLLFCPPPVSSYNPLNFKTKRVNQTQQQNQSHHRNGDRSRYMPQICCAETSSKPSAGTHKEVLLVGREGNRQVKRHALMQKAVGGIRRNGI